MSRRVAPATIHWFESLWCLIALQNASESGYWFGRRLCSTETVQLCSNYSSTGGGWLAKCSSC